MLFAGKVVLITGASSGIGAETAIHLSKKGASLSITGRNAEDLQKVADKCTHQPIFIVAGDLTNENDTKNILESTIKHYGKLDVLVNNAGTGTSDSIQDPSLEKFDSAFNINVRSVYHLTMLAVPYLIETKGNIVNVSSLVGIRAFPLGLSYCMCKAALDQFTRCTAMELAEKQVRVNSINPATVATKFHGRAGMEGEQIKKHYERGKIMHPLGRIGTVEDMASAIAFLASDDASFITGVTLSVDGGRHAATPR